MADDNSQKGFKVVDRRVGTEGEESSAESSGEASGAGEDVKEQAKAAPEPADKPDSGPAPTESADPGPEDEAGKGEAEEEKEAPAKDTGAPPPVTFPSFLLSLHTSALIHLGLIPEPANNQKALNLELARQNIDLLEMLQQKTKGNLSEEETKLFDNILYELRMVYVQVCEESGGEDCKS